ncbi:SCAMP1 isoform 6, partial [Pan troglodytes]
MVTLFNHGGASRPFSKVAVPFYIPASSVWDPSVTQVTRNVPPGLDEYNPFSDSRTPPPGSVKMPNVPNTQPAIMKPTEEHPAYTQIAKEHALAQAELLKRQEELERKAAELDRREREMQ